MAATDKTITVDNKAHDGYRRAGIRFCKGVTVLELAKLSKDQLAMLEADPRLQVGEVDEAPAPEATKAQGAVADGSLDVDVKPKTTRKSRKKS